jgi:hypothetical protein
MTRQSTREKHPVEVSQLAALLRRLWENSGITQKDLVSQLPTSTTSMSRYLTGQDLIREDLLEPFLKLTGASEDDGEQARRLMGIIISPAQPVTDASIPSPITSNVQLSRLVPDRGRQPASSTGKGRVRDVMTIGIVLVAWYVVMSGGVTRTTPTEARCSTPTPAMPTAWTAKCTGTAVSDSARREFAITDLAADRSAVLVQIRLNNGETLHVYNAKGGGKPPLRRPFPRSIEPGVTFTFRTCLQDRNGNAEHVEDRGPRECGPWVVDSAE